MVDLSGFTLWHYWTSWSLFNEQSVLADVYSVKKCDSYGMKNKETSEYWAEF